MTFADQEFNLVLQVKYVQARDAGVYECQVGTEPKMSHFVQLNVVGQWRELARDGHATYE